MLHILNFQRDLVVMLCVLTERVTCTFQGRGFNKKVVPEHLHLNTKQLRRRKFGPKISRVIIYVTLPARFDHFIMIIVRGNE